ncbi:MAG: DUF4159 domain-containing protein [Planctomycetota bacterium]
MIRQFIVSRSPRKSRKTTRRHFLAGTSACGILALAPARHAVAQENSGPVDCGPPPKAKPQSRTGGESFPPLPLPVTPLRRTEKKRPPAPPALVGKLALGPTKFVTRDGKRVKYRDWMTDPADIKSLLNWTNSKLGIHYRAVEADTSHFSFDPREIPALLLTGHNHFALTDDVRAQLARYVLDGGTLIGDACCGWNDFNESFREEMNAIFPHRPLHALLPDDPLFSTYYKLGDFQYQEADGTKHEDEPCLEGISVGCRLGVIYSPVDMTCGWDGHDHPRGKRVVINQARQLGANYITYLLGNYQLGRFLSTEKVYHEASAPTRDDFVLAQIMHEGDWDPDPSAVHNLLRHARDSSTMEVKFKRVNVRLTDPRVATFPLLYMTGHYEFLWDEEEVERLRKYLLAGGMLVADACCGRLAFDQGFRQAMARVFPDKELETLPVDHPVYSMHYDVHETDYTARTREDFGELSTPALEGISLDGRLAVVYSRFDLGNGWEQFPHPYSYGYESDDALKLGTNLLVYAVMH